MTVSSSALFDELSRELGAELVGDPYPAFAQRRHETPVMQGDIMAEFGLPSMAQSLDGQRAVYTLFRYDDIARALKDGATYSSSVADDVMRPILGRFVLGMGGAEHRAWRGLMAGGFARPLVAAWQTQLVRPVARSLVADIAASGGRASLVDFALRFPVRMVYEIMGFPRDAEAYERFAADGLRMGIAVQGMNASSPEETMRALRAAQDAAQTVYDGIRPIVEARRAAGSPGDDLIGNLLRGEFGGERLDDDQITVFLRGVLPAAAETTTRSWLNIMACLLQRPAVLDRVRADRSLLPRVIDEGLRFESATTVLGRITTRDVDVRGVRIPAGSGVTLATASGNRDEAVFPDPDVYDIDRPPTKPALNFGLGPHFCPGSQVAKVEMLEATEAVLDLLAGLRLDPDAAPPAIRGLMMRSPERLSVTWDVS